MNLLIYGANGYTGALIAREAVRRGMQPILAGRNEDEVHGLATQLDTPARVFSLDDPVGVSACLEGVGVVLHCAGPFSATSRPMIEACLMKRVHYIDITGEISVFEAAKALHGRAADAGIVLCPGVGFDVIPTDCVAARLKEALPDATSLALGFDSRSGLSPGTARTSVEGLAQGGRARRSGAIVTVPQAWRTRVIDFGNGAKSAMTIPWGDVSTAFHSTGIPNIEVYIPASERFIKQAKMSNYIRWALALKPVQTFMKTRAGRVKGPNEATRARQKTWVWGEARNAAGTAVTARVETANGYDVTVFGSLVVARHLLDGDAVDAGYHTPSTLLGWRLVEKLPGSGPIVLS